MRDADTSCIQISTNATTPKHKLDQNKKRAPLCAGISDDNGGNFFEKDINTLKTKR